MALGDPYLTTEEFKARIANVIVDAASDAAIGSILAAVSRQIDNACGRPDGFNKSASAEPRIFDWWPIAGPVAFGDVVSVAEIAGADGSGAYPTVWDAATYVLTPRNATVRGRPYTLLSPAPGYTWGSWPATPYGVRVTGIFGWPAVPAPIVEATFLQASRLWHRKGAPLGIAGTGDLGEVRVIQGGVMGLDRDVETLIGPYRVIPV